MPDSLDTPYFKALRMSSDPNLTIPQARVALRYTYLAHRQDPYNAGYLFILSHLNQHYPEIFKENI